MEETIQNLENEKQEIFKEINLKISWAKKIEKLKDLIIFNWELEILQDKIIFIESILKKIKNSD